MTDRIEEYLPQHKYMICLDSDGTVLDAMNAKHNNCHGPAFIKEWGLEAHRDEVQKLWNEINLYRRSRGVNRFIAIATILKELDGKLLNVDGIDVLENWTHKTKELSASSLKKEIEVNNAEILKKALRFSDDVNARIASLSPLDKPPFPGVLDALASAFGKVDIAIVSSSNMSAIKEEWGYYGLLKYPTLVTSLEMGSKKECLKKIVARGMKPENILMVGDAIPDVEAAKSVGTRYYPILINHEFDSWDKLRSEYLDIFTSGRYDTVQQKLLDEFEANFDAHSAK